MSRQHSSTIPTGLHDDHDRNKMINRREPEVERAAAEAYRQYRNMASAPIIWPLDLAKQQEQQLAFLWSQMDPR